MNIEQQAEAFRAQDEFDEVPESWDLLKGMRTKDYDIPVFTYMNDNCYQCLYEDELIRLYLNQALPYPELYPDCPDRAAMSFVHVLTVPKERIYNAAFLRRSDVDILEHMMETFEYYIKNNRDSLITELTVRCVPKLTTDELRKSFVDSVNCLRNYSETSIGFYFHKHPHHSVGHLHMHCLLHGPGLTTPVFDALNYKNTPASEIINGLKYSVPK
jgi:hypothetical protein